MPCSHQKVLMVLIRKPLILTLSLKDATSRMTVQAAPMKMAALSFTHLRTVPRQKLVVGPQGMEVKSLNG